jgi:hypothetical protein
MLTDVASRKATPGEKDRKLFDERGLYLLVKPSGSKLWRMKYRFADKEKKLSIGPYPEISVTAARQARDKALHQLREGLDPSAEKQSRKAQAIADSLDSFEKVARAWHIVKATTLNDRYAAAIMSRLENDVFPAFGSKSIRGIAAPMVLSMIKEVEKRGAHDMAHRIRNHVSDIFVWAIASGLAEADPAAVIRKALMPTNARLRPAMIKIATARKLQAAIEEMPATHWSTLLASRLLARAPGALRLRRRCLHRL